MVYDQFLKESFSGNVNCTYLKLSNHQRFYDIHYKPPDKIAFLAKFLVFTSVTVDRKKCKHHEMSFVYLTSKIKLASLSASLICLPDRKSFINNFLDYSC